MRFKVDWTSLIVGSKCTVFASFYFVFEGNLQFLVSSFLPYRSEGLIFGGAYTWWALFSEFYGSTLVLTVRRYLQRANMDNIIVCHFVAHCRAYFNSF